MMPGTLSKEFKDRILGSEWSFGYNCYEVGHTWTPSCTAAALEVSLAAAIKILPLYSALYTFSQVAIQRKYDCPASWETLKSIMRSSFFILFHAYNGSLMGCALRKGFGRFYYRVLVCAPALLSSYISLLIEKPSRRQALAFYLLNLASEIVYRMAVTKGYFKPLKYGETLVFSLSLGAWYHFIKLHGFGYDPVSAAVKLLIGRAEAKSRAKKSDSEIDKIQEHSSFIKPNKQKYQLINRVTDWLRRQTVSWTKHPCCPHTEASCLEYVLSPLPTRFLLGYGIQSLLNLTKNPLKIIQSPGYALYESLTSRSSIKFGTFLATLVSSGRMTNCCLRSYSNSDEVWHSSVSGFVAGLSMVISPRSSLSMYIMWKAIEQYYLKAAREGQVRYFDFTIMTLYSISASIILYTFALEPRFVRPSYMKFLDNLSDHRLHQLNRMVLDVFGTGSSIGYEDYFPDLDPKHMSNQFKELIFNWMIQPYD